MPFYPTALQPYVPLLTLLFFFVDGLIFGVAIGKSVKGLVLFIAAFALADFIALTFIAVLAHDLLHAILTTLISFLQSFSLSSITMTFGMVLWFVGLAVGFVKSK